jgi:beta-glucosidase
MRCLCFSSLILALAISFSALHSTAKADDAAKPATAKPAETKAEAKPADTKAAEAKPTDTKAADTKQAKKKKSKSKAKKGDQPSTVIPSSRSDKWWTTRHDKVKERVKQGNVDLIFIGDSITNGWDGKGSAVWDKSYGKRNAVNLGFSGDRTQHVLWRLDNGEIDGISPKLAVIMIGTNNSGQNKPEDIAAGVKAIVERLRTKLPQTKILVLGIFPRGADDKDAKRQVNTKTNEIIAKLADEKEVFYQDIGAKFLAKDGTLPKEIMPDLLHPNAKGYAIWAEAIEPTVAKCLDNK